MTINTQEPARGTDLHLWFRIDWAMRGITLAMHLCSVAGLDDLARELGKLHESARIRRDAA